MKVKKFFRTSRVRIATTHTAFASGRTTQKMLPTGLVWVLGINHHAKKGSKMVVMMDLDQNLFPSTAPFCFHG